MSSGVNVHADCQSTFQQLSEGKRTLRYIIYKIDGKDVVVEAAVSPNDVSPFLVNLNMPVILDWRHRR
jgi:hypothetical protein